MLKNYFLGEENAPLRSFVGHLTCLCFGDHSNFIATRVPKLYQKSKYGDPFNPPWQKRQKFSIISDMQKCVKTKIRVIQRKFNGLLCSYYCCQDTLLKLYQKLLNNILHWNPEGFFDTSIVQKRTVSLKPLKKPQNDQF